MDVVARVEWHVDTNVNVGCLSAEKCGQVCAFKL